MGRVKVLILAYSTIRVRMQEQNAARRTRDEVVTIILRCLTKQDESKTNVMHEARTNQIMMNTIYEPYVFENALVHLVDGKWSITKKGQRYLELEEQKLEVLEAKKESDV
ncbi:MAG: winged helix-turn-helix domain-containing protein [Nitrososphaera sp.]|nr:winged helix-turn-helix domain-containing protein [Nitrososphaera sp.]